jgi:hypothetical protein
VCLIEAKASHRQNVGRGFILRSTLTAERAILHPRYVEVPIQGIMPSEESGNHLDCSLLRDKNLALVPRLGPEINSRACHWEGPRSHHRLWCWFTSHRPILILLLRSCFETPRAGSGPTNPLVVPLLASLSAVSLLVTPACPGTK